MIATQALRAWLPWPDPSRDESHSPIEGLRIKLALMGLKPWAESYSPSGATNTPRIRLILAPFGTVDLSFHLRSPVEGLSIPAMQKNPPQLGNSRICGKSMPAFCPANIAFRDSKPRSHSDKSLKHFLSKRPIAIYLRCPSHQLHIVALPRTSWQVTGPPTTNYSLTS